MHRPRTQVIAAGAQGSLAAPTPRPSGGRFRRLPDPSGSIGWGSTAPVQSHVGSRSDPMGYGVIGSPTGSGPVSLGSSPSTPATSTRRLDPRRSRRIESDPLSAPLCSGLARRPLKAVAPVRIRSGLRDKPLLRQGFSLACCGIGPALFRLRYTTGTHPRRSRGGGVLAPQVAVAGGTPIGACSGRWRRPVWESESLSGGRSA